MKIAGLFAFGLCRFCHPLLRLPLSLCPVLRQVDVIHQLPQAALITTIKVEHQPGQMTEAWFVVCLAFISMLMKVLTEPQVGKRFL